MHIIFSKNNLKLDVVYITEPSDSIVKYYVL